MHINEVRKKAREMDINTYKMKKVDIIRNIQGREKNVECFATPRVADCGETECLWRQDCLNGEKKSFKQE